MKKLWRWLKGYLPWILISTFGPTVLAAGITDHFLGDWNYWWVWVIFGVTLSVSFIYFTFIAWKKKPA